MTINPTFMNRQTPFNHSHVEECVRFLLPFFCRRCALSASFVPADGGIERGVDAIVDSLCRVPTRLFLLGVCLIEKMDKAG